MNCTWWSIEKQYCKTRPVFVGLNSLSPPMLALNPGRFGTQLEGDRRVTRLAPSGRRKKQIFITAPAWHNVKRRLFITGSFTHFQGVPRNGFARLNSDGSLDLEFRSGQPHPAHHGRAGAARRLPAGLGRPDAGVSGWSSRRTARSSSVETSAKSTRSLERG